MLEKGVVEKCWRMLEDVRVLGDSDMWCFSRVFEGYTNLWKRTNCDLHYILIMRPTVHVDVEQDFPSLVVFFYHIAGGIAFGCFWCCEAWCVLSDI